MYYRGEEKAVSLRGLGSCAVGRRAGMVRARSGSRQREAMIAPARAPVL